MEGLAVPAPFSLRNRWVLLLVFALSGCAALMYESMWTHYLKLFLGHAAYAQVVVLVIFMGGMALGAFLASHIGFCRRRPLFTYILVELAVGLFGLLFHPVFQWTVNEVFPGLQQLLPLGLVAWVKYVLAAALVFPQSVLLGATFPLIGAGIVRQDGDKSGSHIAALYFANSLGASIGVLVCSFLLLPALGFAWSMGSAVLVNFVVALLCIVLLPRDLPEPAVSAASPLPQSSGYRIFLAVAAITGAASFIYEIAWIRMLSMVLGSSTHAFDIMLSCFVLGLAIGGLAMQYGMGYLRNKVQFLAGVQLVMGVLAALSLLFYNESFDLMVWMQHHLPLTDAGYRQYQIASYGICMALMLPTAICAGTTLPLITEELFATIRNEAVIGRVYAANTLGVIIGTVLAVHWLMPLLGVRSLLLAGALLDILLGAWLFLRFAGIKRYLFSAASLAVLAWVWSSVPLDEMKMASGVFRHNTYLQSNGLTKMLFSRDGKTSTVHVVDQDGYYGISNNGKTDSAVLVHGHGLKPQTEDESTLIMLGVLPYAFLPDAKQVLNIGFGTGLTSHTLLRNRDVADLYNVEIEAAILEGARLFGKTVALAFEDKRSHFVIDDVKTYLNGSGKAFDVIVSEPSNPWVSGVASLFSREFYAMSSRYLTEDGLFVQWLPLYHMDIELVSSIYQALRSVYPHVRFYQASEWDVVILASRKEFGPMKRELYHHGKLVPLGFWQIFTKEDLAAREIASQAVLDAYLLRKEIPANSDYFPYVDARAEKARFLQKHFSQLFRLHEAKIVSRIYPVTRLDENSKMTVSTFFQPSISRKLSEQFYRVFQKAMADIQSAPQPSDDSEMDGYTVYDILSQCDEKIDEGKAEEFRKITASYYPYLSDVALSDIFGVSATCDALMQHKSSATWVTANRFWLSRSYKELANLLSTEYIPGRKVASAADLLLLKMWLAALALEPAHGVPRTGVRNAVDFYSKDIERDPELFILLKGLSD